MRHVISLALGLVSIATASDVAPATSNAPGDALRATDSSRTGAANATKRNVLFVISDDLRPELPCYGCSHVVAPRTTALAEESTKFTRAYAQQSLCAPSRNSFLSGRRPDATESWQFVDDFREIGPDWTTLPEAFKKAGYQSVGCGKVYHPGLPPNWDLPTSWDSRMNATWDDWMYPTEPQCPNNATWCSMPEDSVFEDTQTTRTALQLLDNVTASNETKPFFLAVGFRKPHLQWRAPAWSFDAYPGGPNATALANRTTAPDGAVDLAFHMPVAELSAFADVAACGGPLVMAPNTNYPEHCQRSFRYGYYAAVTFMDEQLGILLDAVEDKGLTASTAVIFVGDHGWHLGDQAEWLKFTNYENSVRVPLLIKVPWLPSVAGRIIDAPVELVDLYPTFAGLLKVEIAYTKNESAPLGGRDLSNVLSNKTAPDDSWVARSQFPRCVGGEEYNANFTRNASYPMWYLTDCNDVNRTYFTHMGYSTRDERWRFTAWYRWAGGSLQASGPAVAVELYDHAGDAGTCDGPNGSAFDFETKNLANESAYADVVLAQLGRLQTLFGIAG